MPDTPGAAHEPGEARTIGTQPRNNIVDMAHWANERSQKAAEETFAPFWDAVAHPAFAAPLARANAEMASLMKRRAEALMDLPARLTLCRTPRQLINAHIDAVQDAAHDWQLSTERLWRAWTGAP